MPALPLTATQQAPLQSLFASSPFDSIPVPAPPSNPNSLSLPASRPRSASVSVPTSAPSSASPAHLTVTPPPVRRASATAASPRAPAQPALLASLSFTAPGQCQSVTVPNPTAAAVQLHLTTAERKALRSRGFRLPDIKARLTVPAHSERPLVVLWDGKRDVDNGELVEARTVTHELRLECASQPSLSVLIRLSATVPSASPSLAVPHSTTSPVLSVQRSPLRRLSQWFSSAAVFTSAPLTADSKADCFSASKLSLSARRHSTSVATTQSTASASRSSPPSPAVDDEWSSPRHSSEPPVLSPLFAQHCYTLSQADVYSASHSTQSSPALSARKLSSDGHSRSSSLPA